MSTEDEKNAETGAGFLEFFHDWHRTVKPPAVRTYRPALRAPGRRAKACWRSWRLVRT